MRNLRNKRKDKLSENRRPDAESALGVAEGRGSWGWGREEMKRHE